MSYVTLKNDEKSEEERNYCSKIEIMNLMNFDLSTEESQKFTL